MTCFCLHAGQNIYNVNQNNSQPLRIIRDANIKENRYEFFIEDGFGNVVYSKREPKLNSGTIREFIASEESFSQIDQILISWEYKGDDGKLLNDGIYKLILKEINRREQSKVSSYEYTICLDTEIPFINPVISTDKVYRNSIGNLTVSMGFDSEKTNFWKVILDNNYVLYESNLSENELTNGIHPHFDFVNKKLSEKYGFPIGKGIFGLSMSEINALQLTESELKLIKPYYNSSDNVSRYIVKTTDLSIIYTTSAFKNPHSMDSYPHLKAHLDQFKDVITSDNKPYGLHRARVESFFVGEKIVALRKCAGKPIFAYANGENYMSATFYIIKTNRVNMKYLTGLLNSKLIEFWLKNRGKMQGANYQLDKEPLKQIPIAVPSIEVQTIIANLVDTIILLNSTDKRASNLVLNSYISSDFEKLINGCIYEIYLSEEMPTISVITALKNFAEKLKHINIQNIWDLYMDIDSTGIIEAVDSLALSKSETLRTIILS